MGESLENLLPADPLLGEIDRTRRAAVGLIWRELAEGAVGPGRVVAAPRGAVLYRPRSGQGREEMSLDPMPNLAPKG